MHGVLRRLVSQSEAPIPLDRAHLVDGLGFSLRRPVCLAVPEELWVMALRLAPPQADAEEA